MATPKYQTFNELNAAYGFTEENGNKSRSDLTEEEERAFVNHCFDLYEHIGFVENFKSPYTDGGRYNGKTFTVIGRVSENDADLEVLPLWNIRFEDGYEMAAYPEEICIAEHEETTQASKEKYEEPNLLSEETIERTKVTETGEHREHTIFCTAEQDGKRYEFIVVYNAVSNEYKFYYANGNKPNDPDFEYHIITKLN